MLQSLNKKYLACILFAVAVLLFARTASFKAVWDDERVYFTSDNQYTMVFSVAPFWEHPSGMYIPLSYTTWAFVKKYFSPSGFDPVPFHTLNIVMHALNGVLLFYLLVILFRNHTAAFWGALLFLIHPLQVESVAWISEFRGLYSTFFCLITLCIFFNFFNNTRSSIFFSRRYWLAFVFYLLALLAKPSAIVLPLLILALCWRFYPDRFVPVIKSLALWLIPAGIIIFLLLIKNPESPVSIAQGFVIAGFSLFFYLQKIILPYPLVACYGYTPTIVTDTLFSYAALIMCISLFIFLYLKRQRFPDLFTSLLITFICLLPVLGFIPFVYQRYSTVADRYAYMALMGAALLVSALVFKIQASSASLKYAGVVVLLILTFLTVKQTPVWKDEFTLWDHNLKFYNNNATVYYDRGVQYSLKGDFGNALDDYNQALSLKPGYLNALFNRANAYENLQDPASALNDYNQYIQLDAKDGSVYYKRSYLFFKAGKLDEALDDLQRAEELHFPVDGKYKERLLQARFTN